MTPEAERFKRLGSNAWIRCSSWCIRHNWTNHSWHFLMKEKKLEQQKVIAETLNGRLAMLGLVAAATSDLLTGHMFFGIF